MKEVMCFPTSRRTSTGFHNEEGVVVGNIDQEGRIEGTDYKFPQGTIVGGVAITQNHRLAEVSEDELVNPATGVHFKRTKKGDGFFDKGTGSYVKPYA